MHGLQTAHSVYFNLRRQRTGHVMRRRYGARLVDGETCLPACRR